MQQEPHTPLPILAYLPSLTLLGLAALLAALAPAHIWLLRLIGTILYTLIVPAIIIVALQRTLRIHSHPLRRTTLINCLILLLSIITYYLPILNMLYGFSKNH